MSLPRIAFSRHGNNYGVFESVIELPEGYDLGQARPLTRMASFVSMPQKNARPRKTSLFSSGRTIVFEPFSEWRRLNAADRYDDLA
jgi:hypothetical protein